MKIKKTTKITIEEQCLRTVSIGKGPILTASCEQCGTARAIFTRELASAALRVSCEDIDRLIEAGRIHTVEIRDAAALICAHSLAANIEAGPPRFS
jgi:hypothetical protein